MQLMLKRSGCTNVRARVCVCVCVCVGSHLTSRLTEIFTASEKSSLDLRLGFLRVTIDSRYRRWFFALLGCELVYRLQGRQLRFIRSAGAVRFALVLGNRADFGDLGDLGAVGELGGTALVGLIGGNLGFRAFTSHPDVETAVACSKQIQRVRYKENERDLWELASLWLIGLVARVNPDQTLQYMDETEWGNKKWERKSENGAEKKKWTRHWKQIRERERERDKERIEEENGNILTRAISTLLAHRERSTAIPIA